jgi:hypothetical protein
VVKNEASLRATVTKIEFENVLENTVNRTYNRNERRSDDEKMIVKIEGSESLRNGLPCPSSVDIEHDGRRFEFTFELW